MKAELLGFGEIEVDGKRYEHDIVIEQPERRGEVDACQERGSTHRALGDEVRAEADFNKACEQS